MLNTEKFTFRCIGNPRVLFTPQYMHDVEGMRQHLEYEEIDADGNVVARQAKEVIIKRVPMQAPMSPARRGRK